MVSLSSPRPVLAPELPEAGDAGPSLAGTQEARAAHLLPPHGSSVQASSLSPRVAGTLVFNVTWTGPQAST